jgi:4-hydroxy-tetrahydrodipicolinate reductase
MIRIGVSGACGKMGRRIIALSNKDNGLRIVFGLEARGHSQVGKIIDEVSIVDNPERIKDCDCLIEFTSAKATIEHVAKVVEFKKSAVIGTTGLAAYDKAKIKEAAKEVPIVFSPNMSVGVNLLFKLLKTAALILKGYKVSVEEAHHIHKKDAPSGTAKKIAEVINEQGLSIKAEDIRSIREDEIVGDHRVVFESDVDRIELTHSAKTRDIFAQGALTAAKWIVKRKPGLYTMEDVLFSK